jgi:hypothetical protein
MSTAPRTVTNADVLAFIGVNAIPRGYLYTLVWISQIKRDLKHSGLSASGRLELLDMLNSCTEHAWLSPGMVAAVEPMDDRALTIAAEAGKLGDGKVLDVYAKHFATFAALNPSLLAALEMIPGTRTPHDQGIERNILDEMQSLSQ